MLNRVKLESVNRAKQESVDYVEQVHWRYTRKCRLGGTSTLALSQAPITKTQIGFCWTKIHIALIFMPIFMYLLHVTENFVTQPLLC